MVWGFREHYEKKQVSKQGPPVLKSEVSEYKLLHECCTASSTCRVYSHKFRTSVCWGDPLLAQVIFQHGCVFNKGLCIRV